MAAPLARPAIAIPEDLLGRFDKLIGSKYANRSEAVRELMSIALRDHAATATGRVKKAHDLLQIILEEGSKDDAASIAGCLASFVEAIRSRKATRRTSA